MYLLRSQVNELTCSIRRSQSFQTKQKYALLGIILCWGNRMKLNGNNFSVVCLRARLTILWIKTKNVELIQLLQTRIFFKL